MDWDDMDILFAGDEITEVIEINLEEVQHG